MKKLPLVKNCFNNSPTFLIDLAKRQDSFYYSHYMEKEIMEDPSYDLNKRQPMFSGSLNIPLHWFHQQVVKNTRIQEASVFF